MADPGPDDVEVRDVAHDHVAEGDVLAHDRLLVGGEAARLAQDRIGDPDLADVVEQPGHADGLLELRVELEPLGDEQAVPRDVGRVTLRVAILGVDRVDQALEHVESRRRGCLVDAPRRDEYGVAPAGLRLAEGPCCRGEQHRDRRAVLGEPADPAADRDRQPLAGLELQAQGREVALDRQDHALEPAGRVAGREKQELVGARAADRHVRRRATLDQLRHVPERLVARARAVLLVEEAEVVQVQQGDRERIAVRLRRLDEPRERADQGTVVQETRQWVPASRLHELDRLACQSPLRSAEDEVQGEGGDQPGTEREEHDVAPDEVQLGEDRVGVSPDAHDRVDLAGRGEGQKLDEDVRRACSRVAPGRRAACRSAFDSLGSDDHRLRPTAGRGNERVPRRVGQRGVGGVAGRDQRAVGQPQLDANDLGLLRERRELSAQRRLLLRGRSDGRVEVARQDVGVHECASCRRIAADDGVQGGCREMAGDQHRLRRRRDPDQDQEDAVDQDQDDRSRDAGQRAKHILRLVFRAPMTHRTKVPERFLTGAFVTQPEPTPPPPNLLAALARTALGRDRQPRSRGIDRI